MFPNPFKLLWSWLVYRYARLNGFRTLATEHEQVTREWECIRCPFYQDGICGRCGCLTIAKIPLAQEKCPEGNWKRIWEKNAAV